MSTGARLLVVDDDEHVREALVDVLMDEGYTIDTAPNGHEALRHLRSPSSVRPRVILLDIMMPVMDGIEFRRQQQAEPALADIPVIILTAMGTMHLPLQAAAIFPKPVELNALLDKVASLCA